MLLPMSWDQSLLNRYYPHYNLAEYEQELEGIKRENSHCCKDVFDEIKLVAVG